MIHLYDVSALLYIGNSVERPGDDFISEELHGLPVRGIRYALEKMSIYFNTPQHQIVAVMDSPTNKRELFEEYKSQRKFNREIFVQREFLRFLLPHLGVTMLSQQQFEADDLFYCYILDLFGSNSIPASGINLHCDDRDLVGCIMTPNIGRIGLTSKTPAMFSNNYSAILSKDEYVHYNSILPYTMFFGKASNNLHRFKSVNPKLAYLDYLNYVGDKYPAEYLSFSFVFEAWLEDTKQRGEYPDSFYEEVQTRMPVVFPRLDWDKDKAIVNGKLNKEIATDFLTLLQEKSILRMLGLTPKLAEQVNTSLLDKWISLYRSGAMMVDNYQTADTTFFFEEDETGGNIGGF